MKIHKNQENTQQLKLSDGTFPTYITEFKVLCCFLQQTNRSASSSQLPIFKRYFESKILLLKMENNDKYPQIITRSLNQKYLEIEYPSTIRLLLFWKIRHD